MELLKRLYKISSKSGMEDRIKSFVLDCVSDVKFVLECDRKGCSNVVSIGKTDVVELKMRGLEIPVCNIGCGYYEAHKSSEYTMFSELQNSLSFVRDILKAFNYKL